MFHDYRCVLNTRWDFFIGVEVLFFSKSVLEEVLCSQSGGTSEKNWCTSIVERVESIFLRRAVQIDVLARVAQTGNENGNTRPTVALFCNTTVNVTTFHILDIMTVEGNHWALE